jgi:hypothetical protein
MLRHREDGLMRTWRSFMVALGLMALPSVALAVPAIVLDTVPGGAGGTMTYDGVGGPLIANDILFVEIMGTDTPANSGATLVCSNCLLDFTTGANTQ